MSEDTGTKYCCLCGKEIIIGEWCNAEHQQYNFIAHIMGQPMLCSECWKSIDKNN